MIQSIFFPFTHIQTSDIEAVSSIFKSILFFPASLPDEFGNSLNHIEDKEFLLPVYDEQKHFEQVMQKVNEYRVWGELNKDNKGNLKTFLQDKPYFTDGNGLSNIRSGIKRTSKESGDANAEEDSLLKSLMFLRLAKIHDMEKESLSDKLGGIEKDEQKLFSSLRGIDYRLSESSSPISNVIEDLGGYMTSQRISAWVDFFNRKKPFSSFDSPLLFVTTSSAVLEYLLSVSQNKIKILDINNLKVHEKKCDNKTQWVETFNDYVENLVINGKQPLNEPAERDDNCTLEVKIKLYVLQGDVISSFFQGIGNNIPVCFVSV